MTVFSYKGRNTRGEMMQGTLEGTDSGAVADQLFNTGITPIEIAPSKPGDALSRGGLRGLFVKDKVTVLDIMMFSRQMHTLLRAGVPILRALAGMQQSARNPAFANVVRNIHDHLDKGYELSVALRSYPALFSPFYVSMVQVGEMTGRIDEIFLRLFEHLEFEKKMHEQIRSALRYPSFVVIAITIGMVILNVFVIPIFAKVYAGFKTELPIMTKILIGTSNFTVHYWPMMLGAVIAAVLLFRTYTNTKEGRYNWDKRKLRLPIAGSIIFKATMSRFARSFALAGKSGVPIVQAFGVVAQVVDNSYIAQRIEQMRDGVERGESVLHTALATGVFAPLELQMIAVGEETGDLDNLMMEVARMYEDDVEYQVSNLSAQIEPILLVFLALMVLTMALGIFVPMWDMGTAALHK